MQILERGDKVNLNRKGYMLVEIVVSSVLAITISYYLLNLTYKFKDKNEDMYQSYFFMSDKVLLTKNIMSDLEKGIVVGIYEKEDNYIIFDFLIDKEEITKRKLLVEENKISYGKVMMDDMGDYIFDKDDISYYEKELHNYLVLDDINYIIEEYLNIEIPVKSIYSDIDYGIKMAAKRKFKFDVSININNIISNNSNILFGVMINNKDLGLVNDLCDYYSKNTTIKIYELLIDGTKIDIEDIIINSFDTNKDIYLNLEFDTNLKYLNYTIKKDELISNDVCH